MNALEIIFWTSLACVGYTYVGYPLLLWVWARLKPAPPLQRPFRGTVSIVLAARNEEATIARRLTELCRHIKNSGLKGEIVLISDGSTDATAARARAILDAGPVRLLELPENLGKAAALTIACQSLRSDVIVFADARQTWADDALTKMLENFADPNVGAVSGDLVLQPQGGVMAGVGLYWRFEKWLRKTESLIHAQVGVTGAISAVRRELFRPIPPGTILDDVCWPLQVAMQGYRVVHDGRAVAYDCLPDRPADEFRRKIRTLSGNYQLACRLPQSLLPWRNPVWLAWISHKLLRLAMPWALLSLLVSSLLLTGPLQVIALEGQLTCYVAALLGLLPAVGRKHRLAAAAGSFLVLNAAAGLALWIWLRGRTETTWHKVSYKVAWEKGEEPLPVVNVRKCEAKKPVLHT
jgi:cellulose synthase/poly-beta-1,6-N-acetylglucosamine synthase-like glycosyltransferase